MKTLSEFILKKQEPSLYPFLKIIESKNKSIEQVFSLFSCIHKVTDNLASTQRITKEMLYDFAMERTKYIEIRTTPRKTKNYTKEEYVESIIDTISDYKKENPNHFIKINLILSVNRTENLDNAYETVELIEKYKNKGVIGIDFSGNPIGGSFSQFLGPFELARKKKIKTTIHFAEMEDEKDSLEILKFKPDRLGHACCMEPNVQEEFFKSKIPIEICLTSNLRGENPKSPKQFNQHILLKVFQSQHPFTLCVSFITNDQTDDLEIFQTNLTQEYEKVQKGLGLSDEDLFSISRQSIEYIFDNEEVKKKLHQEYDTWKMILERQFDCQFNVKS